MLVDAALTTTDLHDVPDAARRASRPPATTASSRSRARTTRMFPLLLAAEHTERVQLTTAVVIAFARNPMTLAQSAYDLQLASRGRFNLGLGTQIKPHIEKRFSMEWSKPVERMREMVLAIRAIWASLARRHEARLPRRLLHAHADDAVLQSRARTRTACRASSSAVSARG